MRRIAIVGLMCFAAATFGCGKSEEPAIEAQAKAPPVLPEVVVREFLEAVRTGDHQKAESMLTDIAREKTKKMDLMVAPPGSPTAKFELGEVEVMEGQVAHVESLWTDIGDDGKPQTNMFVWALRLEENQGWRIGGVATKLFDDAPLLLLNFEDPEDMLRKTQLAEQEMQRRQNGGAANGAQVAGGTAAANAQGGVQAATATNPVGVNNAPNNLPPMNNAATALQPSTLAPGALPPGVGTPGNAASQQLPPGAGASFGGISNNAQPLQSPPAATSNGQAGASQTPTFQAQQPSATPR